MAANKEAPYAEFGKKLMGLRKKAGMTRAELGEICDVAPQSWARSAMLLRALSLITNAAPGSPMQILL